MSIEVELVKLHPGKDTEHLAVLSVRYFARPEDAAEFAHALAESIFGQEDVLAVKVVKR